MRQIQPSTWLKTIRIYGLYIWQRGQKDSVRQWAASLTYTSLLAIVPLFSVSFAIFSAFPAYKNLKSDIQNYILSYLVPEAGSQIKENLEAFVSSTGSLTTIGVIFLVASSVLLLLTINTAFNRIFHVKRDKNIVPRLLMFWAVLTLVPLLLGAGMSLLPIIQSIFGGNSNFVNSWLDALIKSRFILPLLFETIALLILFMAVPNTQVPFKDAIKGAFIGAISLEILKAGFAFYLKNSNYSTIYGTFATVPIFFIWLFLCWNLILFSAVIVASMPEWRAGVRQIEQVKIDVYTQFHTAIALLNGLWKTQRIGGRAIETKLIKDYKLVPWILNTVTDVLEKEGWIQKVGDRGWVLARDLDHIALYELFELFVSDRPHHRDYDNQQWQASLDDVMLQVQEERKLIMDKPISSLFK